MPHFPEVAESLKPLLAGLAVRTETISISLQPVNRTAGSSRLFVFAPPVGPGANVAVALIEDAIPLPGHLLLRSRLYLRRLYEVQHLSAREIARHLSVSHSTVLAALASAGLSVQPGIGTSRNGHRTVKGQIPFGFVAIENRLVKCEEEQQVIGLVRQLRRNGLSLREIAEELSRRLVSTKNHGIWQANTVRKILDRVESKTR